MTHKHTHGTPSPNVVAYFAESAYITNDVVDALVAMCASDADKERLSSLGFVRNPYEDTAGVLSFVIIWDGLI